MLSYVCLTIVLEVYQVISSYFSTAKVYSHEILKVLNTLHCSLLEVFIESLICYSSDFKQLLPFHNMQCTLPHPPLHPRFLIGLRRYTKVYKERNIASVGDGTAISIPIKLSEIIYLKSSQMNVVNTLILDTASKFCNTVPLPHLLVALRSRSQVLNFYAKVI